MNFNDRVSIELGDNGVAQVRFTRGDKMNALDPDLRPIDLIDNRAWPQAALPPLAKFTPGQKGGVAKRFHRYPKVERQMIAGAKDIHRDPGRHRRIGDARLDRLPPIVHPPRRHADPWR